MTASGGASAAYRVALIGYGIGGAVFHAPLVNAVAGLELTAIVTRSEQKIEQVRRDFPAVKILPTAEEIFANAQDYDLVIVTSPNRYHFPQAKAALEAGLHVVIDKPMATNSEHCRELIALAKKQNKVLTVFQNRRLDGDFLTVKKIIDEDLLGPIVRFESRFERYRPEPKPGAWRELGSQEDGGGLLFDLGTHLIDQACHLFGRPIDVYCELDKRRQAVETDDDCFVALSFASGVRAHLWASVMCRIQGPRFRLFGHRGGFEKYGMDPQEDALRAGMRPSMTVEAPGWGKDKEELWGKVHSEIDGLIIQGKIETLPGSCQVFYHNLLAALRGFPSVSPPVDAQDACQTATIVEAAMKSANDRLVVRL
jgi:scyllo-inositol 2-dehydrogenase (NADP+)